jgi:hypothetical protein
MREEFLDEAGRSYQPGLSVDCVVFGFHEGVLKLLLLQRALTNNWSLPGGFVRKDQDVDAAAHDVLAACTGLTNIFLRQFHLFGDVARHAPATNRQVLRSYHPDPPENHWFLQRFVSAGYYALVDFSLIAAPAEGFPEVWTWRELNQLPELMLDHRQIVDKALEALRRQLLQEPVGYQLLPEKFTMPELQRLYEAILGYPLDRRNFHRKMLSYGILEDLHEVRQGTPHKSPRLYAFDPQRYQQAMQQGLRAGW